MCWLQDVLLRTKHDANARRLGGDVCRRIYLFWLPNLTHLLPPGNELSTDSLRVWLIALNVFWACYQWMLDSRVHFLETQKTIRIALRWVVIVFIVRKCSFTLDYFWGYQKKLRKTRRLCTWRSRFVYILKSFNDNGMWIKWAIRAIISLDFRGRKSSLLEARLRGVRKKVVHNLISPSFSTRPGSMNNL